MLPPRSQAQYKVCDNEIYTATCLTKQKPLELLQNIFGHRELKPGQEDAINAIFSGCNSIVLIPTSGGKTVVYALPCIITAGLGVVVSALIMLMVTR
mgnify:CR=1 FL=1